MQKKGFRGFIPSGRDLNLSETQLSSHSQRLCVGFRYILRTRTGYLKAELSFEAE